MKYNTIKAVIRELEESYTRCNVPSLDDLMNASLDHPFEWV